jgi:signal transduction histidine kinase
VRLVRVSLLVLCCVAAGMRRADAATTEAPAETVAQLVERARQLETTDLVRAWELAEAARAQARTPLEVAQAELRRGAIQRRRGEYEAALATARTGLARAEGLGNDRLLADFLLLTGQTEWSLTNFPAAVESFTRGIGLAEGVGDAALCARAHSGLAITYRDLQDKVSARRHYELALSYGEKAGDPLILALVLNNYGLYLTSTGQPAQGEAMHRRALALREAAKDDGGIADSFFNLGTVSAHQDRMEEAIEFYRRAQAIYERLGFARNLANLHHTTAGVLRQLGRTDEGLEHLQAALRLSETLKTPLLTSNVYKELAATMAARGDYRAAFEHQNQFIAAHEAVRGTAIQRQVAALNVRYEAERRQHEIELLRREQDLNEAELRRARTQRYALLLLLGLGVVAVSAIVSRQRLKLATERRVLDETRVAKEVAERADAFKTRLVGVASHDLKAPVAAMIVGAETLQREPGDPAAVSTMARLVANEGRRVLTLIRDLLDFAALEQGRLELDRTEFDLSALLRECVELAQPRAQAKQQSLECTVSSEASGALVSADPRRLRQVIDNLLDNAIKFTPSGGWVRAHATGASSHVRIAIEDSGPGLQPEDYARLFQPFATLTARPTGTESSTGLGLSIARELMALHGAPIVVESEPGQGATFSFELPVSPSGAAAGKSA